MPVGHELGGDKGTVGHDQPVRWLWVLVATEVGAYKLKDVMGLIVPAVRRVNPFSNWRVKSRPKDFQRAKGAAGRIAVTSALPVDLERISTATARSEE